MTQKNEKGLRPWLLRSVAVIIGISYIVAPLQQELSELMHLLSHSFDHGKVHHSLASHTFDFNDHAWQDNAQAGASTYSIEASDHIESEIKGSHDHPHPHNSETHGHEVIDFISMAFSASDPTHQDNEKITVQPDLDKHLVVPTYSNPQTIPTFIKSFFYNLQENTSKGIRYLIVPPPKPLC